MLSTSSLSTLVVAFLAVQATASPAHMHRRHHARHGKRACRAKVTSAGVVVPSGNATQAAGSASLTDAESTTGHELAATGMSTLTYTYIS